MRALICGRGESLSAYNKYNDIKLDYIYLINEFNKFVFQDPDLMNFLNKKTMEGTKIVQQLNIEMAGLDKNFLNSVKINEIFCTRLAFTNESHWWRDNFDQNRFFKSLGVIVKPQPEVIAPYIHKAGNSLPVAILNAIISKKCNKIDIIGSDFYESFYYLDSNDSWSSSQWSNENTRQTQIRLKNNFNEIVGYFKNTNFHIKTKSTFYSKNKNCFVEYI